MDSNKPQDNNQSAKPNVVVGSSFSSPSKRRPLINLAIILLVLLLCVGGYLYYHNHKAKPKPVATHTGIATGAYPINYSLDKLVEQKFAGPAAGQGASFLLPSVILPTGLAHANFASYYSNVTVNSADGKAKYPLPESTVYVFSNAYDSANNPKPDSATLKKDLANSQSAFYQAQTTKVQAFLTKWFPTNTITIQSIQPDSKNASALVYNFTAPLKGATTSGSGQTITMPNYAGKLVYIYGTNASYYFIIKSIDYNLQNNSATWQKVIDSIKVDQ